MKGNAEGHSPDKRKLILSERKYSNTEKNEEQWKEQISR